MSALAALHVARKALALSEDDYRAVLARVTGKASAKDMSEAERQTALAEFRRLGFREAVKGGVRGARRPLEGKYAAKLQALWIAAWNLGIARNRDDRALIAFAKRQTGIDHVRFLRHAEDAAKVIEALKGWMAREAQVDWADEKGMADYTKLPAWKIACAQFAILSGPDGAAAIDASYASLRHWLEGNGFAHPSLIDGAGWQAAMNTLGAQVRALKPRGAS